MLRNALCRASSAPCRAMTRGSMAAPVVHLRSLSSARVLRAAEATSTPTAALLSRLKGDLKTSMLAKNKDKTQVIRAMLADIAYMEKNEKAGKAITDLDIIHVLQKTVVKRKDSIAQFTQGGRADLVEKETAELAVILDYLPQQYTEEEVTAAVKDAVAAVGAKSLKDMGKVIGHVTKALDPARTSKQTVAEVAKAVLSASA